MKKFLIIMAVIATLGILVVSARSCSSEKDAALDEKLSEAHCAADWKDSSTNKKKLINQVQRHPDLNREGLPVSMLLGTYLKDQVKYPATLQVKGRSFNDNIILTYMKAYDLDVNAGTWQYRIPFTSENKLGMKVKSVMYVDVAYKAGCEPMSITKIVVK